MLTQPDENLMRVGIQGNAKRDFLPWYTTLSPDDGCEEALRAGT